MSETGVSPRGQRRPRQELLSQETGAIVPEVRWALFGHQENPYSARSVLQLEAE